MATAAVCIRDVASLHDAAAAATRRLLGIHLLHNSCHLGTLQTPHHLCRASRVIPPANVPSTQLLKPGPAHWSLTASARRGALLRRALLQQSALSTIQLPGLAQLQQMRGGIHMAQAGERIGKAANVGNLFGVLDDDRWIQRPFSTCRNPAGKPYWLMSSQGVTGEELPLGRLRSPIGRDIRSL